MTAQILVQTSPAAQPATTPRPTGANAADCRSEAIRQVGYERDFIAMLKTPIKPWLIDFSDADLKANLRSDLARRDVKGANMYAAELARRNTLRQMERELGYAALATGRKAVAA